MVLDYYVCELCILQQPETSRHPFLRCNFAKARWQSIGMSTSCIRPMVQVLRQLKDSLQPFSWKPSSSCLGVSEQQEITSFSTTFTPLLRPV
ncbi:hypothetical protein HU200_053787 [Digitaria exilis]|uniref:Reverse transcriptase zinc-binding domain-containing protein n=1 Tax=Digitaria exilis TaxID=1010633 RepID=A0A835E7H3_9POAL|nr:hypothetical protein HU200_053787 [Digitaria exilis]